MYTVHYTLYNGWYSYYSKYFTHLIDKYLDIDTTLTMILLNQLLISGSS